MLNDATCTFMSTFFPGQSPAGGMGAVGATGVTAGLIGR
jgi:hypothetical protein